MPQALRSAYRGPGGVGCSVSMKLVRLALLTFDPAPENWREWVLHTDGASIQTEWSRERESGGLQIFVVASTDLSERPEVNEDGLVIVPEEPLKLTEALIETSANLVAISERCKRSISSPMPSVAFLPEDQETWEWLDSTNGVLRNRSGGVVSTGGPSIDLDTTIKLASDRSDGVALLAEALAHEHPTGMFHELMRLFERAFRLGPYKLVQPLAEFLAGADNMNCTSSEVERWIITLRHPATHADRRPSFVLESDVRPVIPRMIQAAYDVLFNKEVWRTPSTQRRDLWRPTSGTTGESFDLYLVQGNPMRVQLQHFDEVGSYPLNLEEGLRMPLPPELWAKWPSESDDNAS
jgi:hypothetical protein